MFESEKVGARAAIGNTCQCHAIVVDIVVALELPQDRRQVTRLLLLPPHGLAPRYRHYGNAVFTGERFIAAAPELLAFSPGGAAHTAMQEKLNRIAPRGIVGLRHDKSVAQREARLTDATAQHNPGRYITAVQSAAS